MNDIQKFSYEHLLEVLEQEDIRGLYEKKASSPDAETLLELFKNATHHNNFTEKTVLGIDVYQYSQYHSLEQSIVPFLFKLIYNETCDLCLKKTGFVFQKYQKTDFKSQFIDTGDGGFQLFETPLHGILFAIHFELFVRYYNSFQFYPKLRKLIGPLNLRYAMTHDQVFEFDNNFYGPCIINNNRILSRDSLNRFLIDENTYNWFMLNMSGLENLQILSLKEIQRIQEFVDYKLQDDMDSIFPMDYKYDQKESIIGIDVQKIGKIQVKSSYLSIYNLHIQYLGGIASTDDPEQKTVITLTLGNLNTSGID